MLTRHDHHTLLCTTPGCPCEEIAEERHLSRRDAASDMDADMAAGRAEDAAERWAA